MTDTIKIDVAESSVHDFIGCDQHGNMVGVTAFDPKSQVSTVVLDMPLTSSTVVVPWTIGDAAQRMGMTARTELDMLRDDKAKLENDLAYERYRVRQLELSLGAAKQPLSFAWHDQPDVAAPPTKGPPPIPARALRPLSGHPMPGLTE